MFLDMDFQSAPLHTNIARKAKIAELVKVRRLVNQTWAKHGGVGGGMALLRDTLTKRIKRLRSE